jgi:formylglycine-generating enzyme required for sulfatase activity
MARIEGGEFRMGDERFYAEERPVHRVTVDGFWIDTRPVTNREFGSFVAETGHVTLAERPPDPALYPDAAPEQLVPGSILFRRPARRVRLTDWRRWWVWVPGASRRHPEGAGSSLGGLEEHPVVHVGHEDAEAYARWAGKQLPSEAQWEYAARGGLDGAVYAWGDDPEPEGRPLVNSWQGEFPWQNLERDGFAGTSPVGSFPPNGYGLYDMTGNVWEWTRDWFTSRQRSDETPPCCAPRADSPDSSSEGAPDIPRRVIKGGSHLCAPNYCLRYRPAARQAEPIDSTTSHIGFRCVVQA